MKKVFIGCFLIVFSQLLFAQAPSKPGTPTGTINLCQGSGLNNYTSTGSTGATSYSWSVTPATAGIISGTGLAGSMSWNAGFTGNALIRITATNAFGSTVSDSLVVSVWAVPAKPGTPTGQTPVCQNTTYNYTSTGGANASSYVWSLNPASAGTITGSGTTVSIHWGTTYSGIAYVKLKGSNPCTTSIVSDSLAVTINPIPAKPGTPVGASPVCPNATTIFATTGAANATSYLWNVLPSTAGNFSGTNSNTVMTWNQAFFGIARIIVFGNNACGLGPVSDTLQVTVNPLPLKPGIPTGTTPICMGTGSSTFTTTGSTYSNTYTWTLIPATAGTMSGTGLSGTVSWVPTFNGTAKIIVKGVNTCGGGPTSDTLVVNVLPLPGKPATPSGPNPICQGTLSSIYTTTGGTSTTSYIWYLLPATAGTSVGSGLSDTVSWNTAFSGTAKIFVRGVNMCGNGPLVSDTLFITVNPLPLKPATPTGTNPICQGSAVSSQYTTAGATNATTYQWAMTPATAGSIAGTGTTSTLTWNSTFSGTVKIVVTGVNSCGLGPVSDTLFVIVNPLPGKPGTPTGLNPICQGTVTSTDTTSGATNAIQYIWYLLPASAGSISGTGTVGTITWSNTFNGVARVFVKGQNACGTGLASDTLFVTVNPLPGKPATPTGPNPICQGTATSVYSTTGGTNCTSYLWYLLPATAGSIAGTGTSGTVTWNATFYGTAKVFVKGVNACGNGLYVSDTLFVTVNPLPAKPGTPVAASPICQGTATTNVITTGSNFSTSYQWNLIPATAGTIAGTTTSATITWNSTFYGIAKVIVYGSNSCGLGPVSDTLQITISPLPLKPAIPVGPTSVCQGVTTTAIQTAGGTYSTSYIWSMIPAAAGSIAGTNNNATITWNLTFTGVAKIYVKGVNNCGQGPISDTLFITVHPTPVPNLGADTVICSGLPLTLNPGNFAIYFWSDNSVSPTMTVNTSGTYWVDVTDNFNCTATDTIHVLYTTLIANAGNDTTVCPGTPVNLNASGGTAYLWSNGAPTQQTTVSPNQSTWYFVTVTLNGTGCLAMDSILVSTLPPTVVTINPPFAELCQGDSITFTASGADTYLWSGGSQNASINISPMGNTLLGVTGYGVCNSDTAMAIILVHPLPNSEFDVRPVSPIVSAPVYCYSSVKDSLNYFWIADNTLSGSGDMVALDFPQPGNHVITLLTINKWGCMDSTTKTVFIKDEDAVFYIPNAFTPDSDNKNDVFQPKTETTLEYYEFRIFNRWGEQMFMTSDIDQGWDGKYKGKVCDPNTYVWIIYYKTPGLYVKHKLAGKVTLVR